MLAIWCRYFWVSLYLNRSFLFMWQNHKPQEGVDGSKSQTLNLVSPEFADICLGGMSWHNSHYTYGGCSSLSWHINVGWCKFAWWHCSSAAFYIIQPIVYLFFYVGGDKQPIDEFIIIMAVLWSLYVPLSIYAILCVDCEHVRRHRFFLGSAVQFLHTFAWHDNGLHFCM